MARHMWDTRWRSLFPPVQLAFAYGSAVFRQSGREMVCLTIIVQTSLGSLECVLVSSLVELANFGLHDLKYV